MKSLLPRSFLLVSVCAVAALGLACDAAIPTAPSGTILTISANPSQISLNGTSTITVVGRKPNGSPLNEGTEIFFSTDLGSVNPAVVAVDEDGVARTSLRGDGRVGTAAVEARVGTGGGEGGAGTATIEVLVGRAAGAVSLQVTPSSVPETGGTIRLLALVRDDQGQPLAGVSVNFGTDVGTLQSGGSFITTNAQGEARDTLSLDSGDLNGVAGDSFSVRAEAAAGGGVQNDTAEVSILRLPEADFGFTPNRLTVSFEDRSTGNPTSWFWSFGDGQTSTSRNPTHTYQAAASFTVTLTVRNSVGEDSTSRVVTVSSSN
ncbi:MAG TPA: PKD domain-containing protein [Thermoanaerobaculia bacterium]|nr:PKD domain-containing protein [Thermoanaerobaculia bacterium]